MAPYESRFYCVQPNSSEVIQVTLQNTHLKQNKNDRINLYRFAIWLVQNFSGLEFQGLAFWRE